MTLAVGHRRTPDLMINSQRTPDLMVEDRLYNHLTERRILLAQFLSQFDPLHSQHCTPNQLVRALGEAGDVRVCCRQPRDAGFASHHTPPADCQVSPSKGTS